MKGWVNGVAAYLHTAFPDADVVRGERTGVNRSDNDLIAVWWPGWDELTRDTALASPTLKFRYFPRRGIEPQDVSPDDPDPILDAADALRSAFGRDTQPVGTFTAGLSCRLTTLKPDYSGTSWMVEGTLIAYMRGAAA